MVAPVLRRATVTAAIALLALCPAVARAQEGMDPDVERGVQLRERGDDAGALAAFTAAWERARTPQARAQMGLAALALGRWIDADAWLREALARDDDAWVSARRAVLLRAREEVARHVGTIEVLANVPDAEVLLDGVPAGRTPLGAPLRAPAGTVVVEVRAAGHHPTQRRVVVAAAQLSRESVTLVPRIVEFTPPPPRPAAPLPPLDRAGLHHRATSSWRALSLAAFVTGGAALGAGLFFTAMSASARNDFEGGAGCGLDGDTVLGGADCARAHQRAQTWEGLAIAGFAAGGAMLVTGLALRLLAPSPSRDARALSCGVGPAGAACALRF